MRFQEGATASTRVAARETLRQYGWLRQARVVKDPVEADAAKRISFFRRKFEPPNVKLVIVAEFPPSSGKYFYNPEGSVSEPLFSALMLQLRFAPTSKESGLREFQKRGWVVVDATYVDGKDPDRVITRDYHLLRDDLAAMLPNRSIQIVLVKANRLPATRAKADGRRFQRAQSRSGHLHSQHGQAKRFSATVQRNLENSERTLHLRCKSEPRCAAPLRFILFAGQARIRGQRYLFVRD